MPTPTAAEKPSYLGLLNAISLAESEAGVYLEAWANATDDEELASTLRFVAARETSHGELFCRRLCELGYDLRGAQLHQAFESGEALFARAVEFDQQRRPRVEAIAGAGRLLGRLDR